MSVHYDRGRAIAESSADRLREAWIENMFGWARMAYPAARSLDFWHELEVLDGERLANPPDPARYPETRGLPDRLAEERRGFLDAVGDTRRLWFHYNWYFFISRRLNARYVGQDIRANNCTSVFIAESPEGGPLFGSNLDDVRRPAELEKFDPPAEGPDGRRRPVRGGVSSAVLCDEEPDELFPVDVWDIMPGDCRDVRDVAEFLERYNHFWGPQNGIYVDEQLNAMAFEKSNCRVGFRFSDDGTAAVTACSYLIPEMHAFKEERSRLSLERRGMTEDSPDWVYWAGCDARYRRLLDLVRDANAKGATLHDLGAILTDHDAPFPERVCLAGERGHPDESAQNWTLTSSASVLEGPNRRTLFWRVEGDTPCYENPPFLAVGPGVEARPEWLAAARRPVAT